MLLGCSKLNPYSFVCVCESVLLVFLKTDKRVVSGVSEEQ